MKKRKTRSDSERAAASRDARMANGWQPVQAILPPEDVQELALVDPNKTKAIRTLIDKFRKRRLKDVNA